MAPYVIITPQIGNSACALIFNSSLGDLLRAGSNGIYYIKFGDSAGAGGIRLQDYDTYNAIQNHSSAAYGNVPAGDIIYIDVSSCVYVRFPSRA